MALENILLELSLVLIVAFVISYIVRLLNQPLMIGYILAGIAVSPYFLGIIGSTNNISLFGELGVALLLFMVGLGLNPKIIKEVGPIAAITGVGQIIFTSVIGFTISRLLGLNVITSVYLGLALALSSTIIIMKLLSDMGETTSLYGKISIGLLIVQDVVAITILMIISSITGSGGGSLTEIALNQFLKGLAAIVLLFAISTYILPKITKSIAKSQELLLTFSLAWALALGSLFSYLGFSLEIGALIAGITLSLSPYRFEISSKMKPIRDFFLILFFIYIGTSMSFSAVSEYWPHMLILSLFVLIGNPIIMMAIMGTMGYTKRTGFLSGISISQISEFSFVLIALGISVGHLEPEILSIVAVIAIITMAGSSYMITHGKKLYNFLSDYLNIFERPGKKIDEGKFHLDEKYDIILFGYNRIGYSLVKSFKKVKKSFLIVDFNPETVKDLAKKGINCRYGDAQDSELLEELPLNQAKMFISTIPETELSELLIKKIRRENKEAPIIVVSHEIDSAIQLYKEGATYVITPHFLGGSHTAQLIEKFKLSSAGFKEEGERELQELKARKRAGHYDPKHERDQQ